MFTIQELELIWIKLIAASGSMEKQAAECRAYGLDGNAAAITKGIAEVVALTAKVEAAIEANTNPCNPYRHTYS
tara:strand:- start:4343 stop:4564 length:222 start_codon:yes stop_codon:yes gene_type:complete